MDTPMRSTTKKLSHAPNTASELPVPDEPVPVPAVTVIDGDSSMTWLSSLDGVPSPNVAQNDEPAPDGDAARILLMVVMFATNPTFCDMRNRAPSAASRLYTSPAARVPEPPAGCTTCAVPRQCAMPFGTPVLS